MSTFEDAWKRLVNTKILKSLEESKDHDDQLTAKLIRATAKTFFELGKSVVYKDLVKEMRKEINGR